MAKRARGSTSRPGQRAPIQRTPPRPKTPDIDLNETAMAAYGGRSLSDADLARAAELEAQIVAEEKAATAVQPATRMRTSAVPRSGGTLAATASDEYAYVARDVRRIALIGGSLIALLFGAWAILSLTALGTYH
jgi:hypothetical protein